MKKKKFLALVLVLVLILTAAVPVSAASYRLNKAKTTLYLPNSKKTTLKVSGSTHKRKVWSSSNRSVATVSSRGVVTAKKPGKATITVQIGKKKLRCRVTVKKASIKLNKTSLSLKSGGKSKATLKASVSGKSKKVKWKSSKPSVASVNSRGVVTGKKKGTATITAYANGVSRKCKVTVKSPAKKYAKTGYQYLRSDRGTALTVLKVSGNKIRFMLSYSSYNGGRIGGTNTISATLKGNKVSHFRWRDSNGESGTGSLSFGNKKVTVKMRGSRNKYWPTNSTFRYSRKWNSSALKSMDGMYVSSRY